jgi:hypothetical protein
MNRAERYDSKKEKDNNKGRYTTVHILYTRINSLLTIAMLVAERNLYV